VTGEFGNASVKFVERTTGFDPLNIFNEFLTSLLQLDLADKSLVTVNLAIYPIPGTSNSFLDGAFFEELEIGVERRAVYASGNVTLNQLFDESIVNHLTLTFLST
jgi:hypothetical protein